MLTIEIDLFIFRRCFYGKIGTKYIEFAFKYLNELKLLDFINAYHPFWKMSKGITDFYFSFSSLVLVWCHLDMICLMG